MEPQPQAKQVISLAIIAGMILSALMGAGLIFYGKQNGDQMFVLVGYALLAVTVVDWAVWQLFLKKRLENRRQDGSFSSGE